MVIIDYDGETGVLSNPTTPFQALLIAEAHVQALGYPHLSPLDLMQSAREGRVVCAGFSGGKLTLREVLPGVRLRSGASEIEIVRVRPTEREVTYKVRNKFFRLDSKKFVDLANQQGYRKVWDLKTFLASLKSLLKPVLAAIPLMWVLKLVTNAVRKQPVKFESTIPRHSGKGKLSSLTPEKETRKKPW